MMERFLRWNVMRRCLLSRVACSSQIVLKFEMGSCKLTLALDDAEEMAAEEPFSLDFDGLYLSMV